MRRYLVVANQTLMSEELRAAVRERLGRTDFRAYQASARGGALRVTLAGDRVRLGGTAVTITRGELVAS